MMRIRLSELAKMSPEERSLILEKLAAAAIAPPPAVEGDEEWKRRFIPVCEVIAKWKQDPEFLAEYNKLTGQ